jgi:DNA polymerase
MSVIGGLDKWTFAKESLFLKHLDNVQACHRCRLRKEGQHQCPGLGDLKAKVMFVGEAPGRVENPDLRGLPFVGNRSSDLLLDAVYSNWPKGYDEVYVTNVVKCNPPMNRKPEEDEIESCSPFLREELRIVGPKAIVALGRTAANWFGIKEGLNTAKWKEYTWNGCLLFAKFHPAYILRLGPQAALQYMAEFRLMKKRIDELC